eukprot:4490258-Pyramimonas_sp.AAC.1
MPARRDHAACALPDGRVLVTGAPPSVDSHAARPSDARRSCARHRCAALRRFARRPCIRRIRRGGPTVPA